MLKEVSNILLGAGIASIIIYLVHNKSANLFINKRLLLVGLLLIVISLFTGGIPGGNDFMREFRHSISGK